MMREPPSSTLFPYPSLFRSEEHTSELQSHSHLVCLEFSRVIFRSDRKSTRLNSSHNLSSYAVFCLKKMLEGATFSPTNPLLPAADLAAQLTDAGANLLVTFFFNDTATTEIFTLSLHDALPIWKSTRLNSSHTLISLLEFRRVLF